MSCLSRLKLSSYTVVYKSELPYVYRYPLQLYTIWLGQKYSVIICMNTCRIADQGSCDIIDHISYTSHHVRHFGDFVDRRSSPRTLCIHIGGCDLSLLSNSTAIQESVITIHLILQCPSHAGHNHHPRYVISNLSPQEPSKLTNIRY